MINPGTEPVEDATIENAEICIKQLIEDTNQKDFVTYESIPDQHGEGRFAFRLKSSKHDFTINIDMPGCEPERTMASKPFYSPRLYVDGSSWLWGYALGFADFDRDAED